MKKFLWALMLSALWPLSARAVVPPSTSLELTSAETLSADQQDPRYQVIPVQTVLRVDRRTGKIWILENTKDGDPNQTRWVEYSKDHQPGWANFPR
jgi:hypothetical protein